ncbi:MAG: DNA polymerase III subunit beta [Ruminococcaceae bacterium]|nr:DNA polymerase III subunit beta [Oscillospiraceae bacterium]
MKFHCTKQALQEAINAAGRAVASKSTIPALEGLLINADETLKITGFNLELGIICTVDATVTETGIAVFNAAMFSDIVAKLPNDMVFIEVDEDYKISVRCGIARFALIAMPADEFPELPVVEEGQALSLKSDVLRSMINQTVFSVSILDTKPVLTGALFDVTENTLRVVASDSNRLAIREELISTAGLETPFRFIVPSPALREIEKLLKRDDTMAEIRLTRKHMTIVSDNATLVTRLLEGQFIKYEHFLTFQNAGKVTVERDAFAESVARMDVKNSDRVKNSIRCSFEDGVIRFNYVSSRVTGYDECRYEGECEPIEIGLSNKFVSDALHVIDDEKILLCFNSASSPFVIAPLEGNAYRYIIAPVRLG